MIGARSFPFYACIFLVLAGMILFLSSGVFTSQLASDWEAKYTTLKDDLRTLAVDPLDPQTIYIGTNEQVLRSTDGGETWTDLKSFRDNKISLSNVVDEEALRSILLIEEMGGEGVTSGLSQAVEDQTAAVAREETALGEAGSELEAKKEAGAAATQSVTALESQLARAQTTLSQQQVILQKAQADLAAWTPDPLSISEVEAMAEPYDDGWEEASDQLDDWLSERGLGTPFKTQEKKRVLIDYLKTHPLEGEKLKEAVTLAETATASAQAEVDSLQAALDQARAEEKKTQDAVTAAARAVSTQEATTAAVAAEAPAETGPAATPPPEVPDVTGVTYISIDPSNPDNIFTATFNGIYKSEDRGSSWSEVYQGANPPQSAVLCLAIDPSNPDAVFAGTLSGIARSPDGGINWERPPGRVSDKVITALAVHPFDSQVVLAGTEGYGVFKSTDGGSTWRECFIKASPEANRIHALEFAPSQPEVVYAGSESGVFKSLDGGENWENAGGLGLGIAEVRDLLISAINPETVYLATRRGVFATVNGGEQWRRLTFGLLFRGSNFLAFDPLNPATIWLITDNRVFESAAVKCLDLSSGEKVAMTGSCEITLDGSERHNIVIEDADEEAGMVKIEIQSEPQRLELKVGESGQVDLDGDGKDDLIITLKEFSDEVPQLELEKIALETVPGAETIPVGEITGLEDLEPWFRSEPTWVEVQQAAARWAEVHPDKIAAWRRGASLRAFLPEVTLDFSMDRSWSWDVDQESGYDHDEDILQQNRESWDVTQKSGDYFETQYTAGIYIWEDAYSTENKTQYKFEHDVYEGDNSKWSYSTDTEHKRKREENWSLKLEWELGDFLYSKEQRDISKEARELVELRQDVLEQVTLYYFDRRSARIDMILNPPADPYSRVEMLLRIQQLNASLDTLTGGYFSRTIKEKEKETPSPPLPKVPLISTVSTMTGYY